MMRSFTFLFVSFFLLALPFVSAVAVTPSQQTLPYDPGRPIPFTLSVQNNQQTPLEINVGITGSLVLYLTSTVKPKVLQPGEIHTYDFNLTIPAGNRLAGRQRLQFMVTESPLPSKIPEGISAYTVVTAEAYVQVPVPYLYLSVGLQAEPVNVGEDFSFVVTYNNPGRQALSSARSILTVFSPAGQAAHTERLTLFSLQPGASEQRTVLLPTADLAPGTYNVTLETTYDGIATEPLSVAVQLGHYAVSVFSLTETFTMDTINKVEIGIQNEWNDVMQPLSLELIIFDGDREVYRLPSHGLSLAPLAKDSVTLYWDTSNIKPGSYRAQVVVHYGEGELSRHDFSISVVRPGSVTSLRNAILLVSVLLVLLVIEYALLRRKYRAARRYRL